MGLDMYLHANKDVPLEVATMMAKADNGKEWWDAEFRDYNNESWMGNTATAKAGDIVTAVARVGYWRKANAIHGWFVENVQGGDDDCEEYEVSTGQLQQLRAACQEVLDTGGATDDIRPREGFLFGTDDIEYMLDDCKDTIKQIDQVLKKYPDWVYTYQSSW